MKTKRKMIIAISAFAMVLLAGVIAVVAVLAAQSVTVQSQVTISYTSIEYKGKVKAEYKRAGDSDYTTIGSEVDFDGAEANNTTKTISGNPTIQLDKNTNSSVVFRFTFTKDGTGSDAYVATLTDLGSLTGFDISYDSKLSTNKSVTLSADPTVVEVTFTLNSFASDVTINPNFVWTIAIPTT